MGCDGGTIPRRDELVRVKKKPETKDKDSALAFQWRCCAITQQTLQEPIVVDGLGRLYSKVSLIEALLNKETMPESAKHIKNLKDVKNLNLTPNPVHNTADKKGGATETSSAPYICPVIGLEMSGKFRFVAIWSCGCVFSERALKEVPTITCHKCQKAFTTDDVVIINGNEEDVIVMKTRMELRQAQNKKNKKKIKTEPVEETITSNTTTTTSVETKSEVVLRNKAVASGSNDKNVKVQPLLPSKRLGALVSKVNDEKAKKAKMDYSVAKDPNASDVYKSLFTTHKSEQEQGRAHWITYNPFYN